MSKGKIEQDFNNNIIILLIILILPHSYEDTDFCSINNNNNCAEGKNIPNFRYILYDVNPPEGFNLRRDVYMRLAIFAHHLNKTKNKNLQDFKLVLPPWSDLYHWRSEEDNQYIPWSRFFHLESLQTFAPVIEMYQFFNEIGSNYNKINIDEAYILQNYDDMFETGNFEAKMSIEKCTGRSNIKFYNYENITASNIRCLSFHGHAAQLTELLNQSKSRTIFFDHAEIVLHDNYGDSVYWKARRSMRFNKELYSIANTFRKKYLNSTNEDDNIIFPDRWLDEKPNRNAKGGPYICVHLRRRDFLWGRPTEVPSIENAAKQLETILKNTHLNTVFVATDAPLEEYNELKEKLKNYQVIKYNSPSKILAEYKDGGIAIIEQIICSYAYYFIGTHESTFSFRIQEEREILGFPAERTFNRLCGGEKNICEKPSIWKIVF